MKKKQLIGFAFLSLLLGAGLAGGLYVINTPAKIAPRAVSPSLINQPSPTKVLAPATVPPQKPPAKTQLSEQAIIDAFGTVSTDFDLNQDGTVNSLDILEFRKTLLK
ncbi:hypothetical protein HYU89_02745 [Candidatus Collierbacteria bacterium]|nr:hypothetical protein [Candidatus Collierbacteria bacterium]